MASKSKVKSSAKKTYSKPRPALAKTDNSLLMLLVATVLVVTSYWLFTHFNQSNNYSMSMMNDNISLSTSHMDQMMPNQHVIQLNEQNSSGEYGNAVFSEKNGKTVVKISVKNSSNGISQPAHIHIGSCIDLGKIEYPLTNVVNGESETTLNVTLSDLQKQGPLALNIHKSTSQITKYVSCGNLNF